MTPPLCGERENEMPPVTVNANNPGQPNPDPVPVTPVDQNLTWNLRPSAASFDATAPISFPNPPPAGYDPWPGSAPVLSGNSVTASVNKTLGAGQRQRYKYTVKLANGQTYDPEVENTGTGMGEGGPGRKKP